MLRLLGGDETNVFPTGVLWYDRLVVWPSDFADIVKREFIVALGPQGDERFKAAEEFARADAGFAGTLEKNTMYIGYLLARLVEQKVASPSLDRVCEQIISVPEYAKPAVKAATVHAA